MTQALNTDVFCHDVPVVYDWTVLIEQRSLSFAELNSSNCHSQAWALSKGKPLIYEQIEHLIGCGFKKFLLALFHVDQVVKQQIQQLQNLYEDCTFKCIEVEDSWFFEQHGQLSTQGEKYLQHYIHIFLRHQPAKPSFVWIQKIKSSTINPLKHLNIDPHHACALTWVKQAKPLTNKLENIGLWLDIKGFAYRYKAILESDLRPANGSIVKYCFNHINQHSQDVVLKHKDSGLSVASDQDARHEEDSLVASRCFNQVTIDTKTGVVTKQSSAVKKLQQEVDFYEQLPQHLQIYFPRLVDSSANQHNQQLAQSEHSSTHKIGITANESLAVEPSSAWYSLEYYPYKSLSQYFVYYSLPLTYWRDVFDRLLAIHQQFIEVTPAAKSVANDDQGTSNNVNISKTKIHNSSSILNQQLLNNFYMNKLNQRISQAKENKVLAEILNAPIIRLNDKALLGFNRLKPWLSDQIQRLSQQVKSGFIHGDLCFSNILFEPASGVIRLIDPRGDFMGSVNQGDPRYDLAKILHSVHGRYDFIINDLFVLQQNNLQFNFNTPQTPYLNQLEQLLFTSLKQHGQFEVNDLILLESLLFLTMLPLHDDQPKRQIAFLLTGLKLLNEVHAASMLNGSALDSSMASQNNTAAAVAL